MQFVSLTAEYAMSLKGLEAIHGGYEITPDIAVELEAIGGTAALHEGEVLAIAGILPRWQGCGMAWTWLGHGWRRHARLITDAVRAGLEATEYDRLEAAVRVDYARGHAWMRRLGFELETPVAKRWGPDGADYSIYRRLK